MPSSLARARVRVRVRKRLPAAQSEKPQITQIDADPLATA
jgi:hypothetical protein